MGKLGQFLDVQLLDVQKKGIELATPNYPTSINQTKK